VQTGLQAASRKYLQDGNIKKLEEDLSKRPWKVLL
jgi:hypothetical protein